LLEHVCSPQDVVPENFHDLHKYSVEDYTFWLDLWNFLGIIHSVSPSQVSISLIIECPTYLHTLQIIVAGTRKEVPTWFPGAKLNFAENLLHRKDDSIACTASGESGRMTHISFRQLRQLVGEMAASMRVNGLTVGDRVAG
jgi:acetoacetyl-CoA synthetase